MNAFKTMRMGLALLLVAGVADPRLYAGSTTYTWSAVGGGNLTLVTVGNDSVNYDTLPIPGSITVQVNYNPAWFQGVSTSGNRTTYEYTPDYLSGLPPLFSITSNGSWPAFVAYLPTTLTIIAPPPGQGPDVMEFSGTEGPIFSGFGLIDLIAPNGTLSGSSGLPATLGALYASGGSFDFDPPNSGPGGIQCQYSYLGSATGTLQAVPEPAAIVCIVIAFGICLPYALMRRRRAARAT
jgi:hypothetical protein